MRIIFLFLFSCFSLLAEAPKVVVFDFGGVVAKVDRRPMLEFLSESFDKPYKKVKREFAHETLYIALEKPLSYWEKYGKKPLSPGWKTQFDDRKKNIVREMPGMRGLIEEIKAQGIQVALLSNTRENRARFIEKLGAYDLFDPILLSCYLGTKKPEPEIYTLLLEHLKWGASECLFIDNRRGNVESAAGLGIDTIHFRSTEQLKEALIEKGIRLAN